MVFLSHLARREMVWLGLGAIKLHMHISNTMLI
jgi:hypothetical protein